VQQTFTTENGLPSNTVRGICRDRQEALWVGTDGGIAEFTEGRFVQPAGDAEFMSLPVVALADCGERGLLASTAGGRLFRCRTREFVPFVLDVQPGDVDAFFLDRDGLLWMGTQGDGLWMEAGGRARQITVKDGLYDDEVYGIVADDEDRLWM